MQPLKIGVIGGGAAGFFGAIVCAQQNPDNQIFLFEKHKQVLSKVRISGGGRCNVTHSCFDPSLLVQNYPRGHRALRGPFARFQPKDTIDWFLARGVELKVEKDGRMFPITDNSQTIIDCLLREAKKAKVNIILQKGIERIEKKDERFQVYFHDGDCQEFDRLLIATGSSAAVWEALKKLGHTIIPPVPSLFTFNIPDHPLKDLSGVAVPKVAVSIEETNLIQEGPILITHWGFSGPAILKLSAWGARVLNGMNYKGRLKINWLCSNSYEDVQKALLEFKKSHPSKLIGNDHPFLLPKQLWKFFCSSLNIDQQIWNDLSKHQMEMLTQKLLRDIYPIEGKSTNKDEFVTCGGVCLDEVNFKTMESRKIPHLYFAGEVLDIDGITGGFNFQNAWTTGWIAGNSMSFG